VQLRIQATERTWVSVSAGGRNLFTGVLDVAEQKEIDGLANAKLVTGNAAGLDVRWNGKPLGPLGNRGQVRTIIFTPDKYEFVVPMPKKVVSPDGTDPRPTGVG
jgi:cytoskeleton protein RodZ